MRLLLKIIGGLLLVLVLVGGASYAAAAVKLGTRFTIHDTSPAIPTDSARIAHGKHLAEAVTMCVGCHRENLGGQQMMDQTLFGRVDAANLTRGKGGHGTTLTDDQMVLAIRHGVAEGGRLLFIMPSDIYNHLDDADVADIVAYVRSRPAVDSLRAKGTLGPLGRALFVAGKLKGVIPAFEINHDARRAPAPPPGATADYGRYLVSIAGCHLCHGEGLSGGPAVAGPPGGPPAANITPEGLKAYDEAAFFRALREGKRPKGVAIDSAFMPWPMLGKMTDDEIRAVWKYLQTVPSRPYGNH